MSLLAEKNHFWVRGSQVVLPFSSAPKPAAFEVRDGKIIQVLASDTSVPDQSLPVLSIKRALVLPGLVDTHAHINEPGRTEWEGFETATRAAAAGGITTVIDMPLNSIPATTSLAALEAKAAAAVGKCQIDYGFWGGVVPGNASELEPMVRAGVFGFKCFLCPSGVDEFEHVVEKDLTVAMPILARLGVPLLVHAEIESPVMQSKKDPRTYRSFLESRPQKWEVDAIRMMIKLARQTGCRTHIVHLSASDALADLAEARRAGVPITAETCPHYLAFSAEEIQDGATHFKCCPPIREASNREELWKGLTRRDIEFVVSDHSPCTPSLKLSETGDFAKAWGGISGLQFGLPVVWTELRSRGFSAGDLAQWMSSRTAAFLGLGRRKGAIAPGMDADFVVFDPEAESSIDETQVLHRHKLTPYSGRQVQGRVLQTFLGGVEILPGSAPRGQQLKFERQDK
ncbi:MAG: allantoinase AllB [Oligoflexia bacterium]